MQNIAVVVFFILSGFVIAYSVAGKQANAAYTFHHYLADRFSRIYIAFIPALLFVLICDAISVSIAADKYRYHDAFDLKTFAGNLFMLQDFPKLNVSSSFGSARPFWTLAVEWWIYLFYGYLVLVFSKLHSISLKKSIILGLLAIVPLYNFIGGRGNGLTLFWIFGALAFWIWNQGFLDSFSSWQKGCFLIAAIIAATLRIGTTMIEYEAIFAFALTISILLAVDLIANVPISPRITAWVKFNASFSYSLYLIHHSVYDLLVSHYQDAYNPYLLFIVGFLLSNLVAIALGRIFEVKLTAKVKKALYAFLNSRASKPTGTTPQQP